MTKKLFCTGFEEGSDLVDTGFRNSGRVEEEAELVHRKQVSAGIAVCRKLLPAEKNPEPVKSFGKRLLLLLPT